jgi:hypothetical protein
MLALKGRQDLFRLLLPKEFLYKDIEEKYTQILKDKKSFITSPIDFINETIQHVDVLGFQNGTYQQMQSRTGIKPMIDPSRQRQNEFLYPATEETYRSENSPISLTDKTFSIQFRHTLGFLNYFIIFENFWYMYSRDMKYSDMMHSIYIDIFNEIGEIYCKIHLIDPIINSMDMLSFDYTQPVASSQNFRVEFKYSDFEFEFTR